MNTSTLSAVQFPLTQLNMVSSKARLTLRQAAVLRSVWTLTYEEIDSLDEYYLLRSNMENIDHLLCAGRLEHRRREFSVCFPFPAQDYVTNSSVLLSVRVSYRSGLFLMVAKSVDRISDSVRQRTLFLRLDGTLTA